MGVQNIGAVERIRQFLRSTETPIASYARLWPWAMSPELRPSLDVMYIGTFFAVDGKGEMASLSNP